MKRKIYPPVYALAFLIVMVVLRVYVPLVIFMKVPYIIGGIIVMVAGLCLIFACAYQFKKAKTTILPFHEPSALVTRGLFGLSRNPIYVGMVVILWGAAIAMGGLSPFIMPPLFGILIHYRFILNEEKHLVETFGDDYQAYQATTRRWI